MTHHVDDGYIVILGATSGFGKLLALRLARDYKARLVLFGRRPERGQQVERECVAAGAEYAHFVAGDMGDEHDVDRAFRSVQPGRVSAVFVNGGYFPAPVSYVDEGTLRMVDEVIRSNIRGPIVATRAAVRALREHGGTLVYTSSVAGSFPNGGTAHFGKGTAVDLYAASKSFMDGLARATYAWKDSIRVFTLSPSCFATEMAADDACAHAVNVLLKGVTGKAEHVVDVMVSLIDGRSIYAPGTNIGVEGPYTYNARARYRGVYEHASEMTGNFQIPLTEFRDLEGRHLRKPLTKDLVEQIIQNYKGFENVHDEL